MKVRNVHERDLPATVEQVGKLLDSLASADDALWPRDRWPVMKFDRPLAIGAVGGHGPIGYVVEDYVPGTSVRFRFTRPDGFLGYHAFETQELSSDRTRLRHVLEMEAAGRAWLAWTMVFRPMHDALIEDALDRGAEAVGGKALARPWSLRVQFLRWLVRRRGRASRSRK